VGKLTSQLDAERAFLFLNHLQSQPYQLATWPTTQTGTPLTIFAILVRLPPVRWNRILALEELCAARLNTGRKASVASVLGIGGPGEINRSHPVGWLGLLNLWDYWGRRSLGSLWLI
jgi:hypothetical protein